MWRSRRSARNINKLSAFSSQFFAEPQPLAKGMLGKKVGMTQLFDSKGDVRPVTVLQAGPCVVTQHKMAIKDGYEAAQIGLVEFLKESRLTKAAKGHLAKNNLPPVKFMREVPLEVEPSADGDGAVKDGAGGRV